MWYSIFMRILAIETSCDETALSIIEVKSKGKKAQFKILGNEISSQIELHTQYGGVFPMMAKREHGKNIIGVLENVLKSAKMYSLNKNPKLNSKLEKQIYKILDRENEIQDRWMDEMPFIKKPKIDLITVTNGPGLEPALWVGINFAKALSKYWNIPLVPVNHMEGHIFSIFPKKTKNFIVENKVDMFPMLSLLVSGGHTELVLVKDWMKYKKIGQTRDDAAGEAFDKVARMLGLPYPGGPEISKLANIARSEKNSNFSSSDSSHSPIRKSEKLEFSLEQITFPRPMIYSKNYDFSFSGLKTAVLYLIRDLKLKNSNILQNDKIKNKIACEFENAVVETLVYKTMKAIEEYKIKTLIVGGGVSANTYLQEKILKQSKALPYSVKVHFPSRRLTGDNALMIAIAGYFQYQNGKIVKNINSIKAKGNLSL